jgi:hypothetical protein
MIAITITTTTAITTTTITELLTRRLIAAALQGSEAPTSYRERAQS